MGGGGVSTSTVTLGSLINFRLRSREIRDASWTVMSPLVRAVPISGYDRTWLPLSNV